VLRGLAVVAVVVGCSGSTDASDGSGGNGGAADGGADRATPNDVAVDPVDDAPAADVTESGPDVVADRIDELPPPGCGDSAVECCEALCEVGGCGDCTARCDAWILPEQERPECIAAWMALDDCYIGLGASSIACSPAPGLWGYSDGDAACDACGERWAQVFLTCDISGPERCAS
jgi:hypothetical protein